MKTNSRTGKRITRIGAEQLRANSGRELTALRERILRNDIDTSDIPEARVGSSKSAGRTHGDEHGLLRQAILSELGHRQLTRYELWKQARHFCPKLPESAVYEFLRGTRQVGVVYVEAMLQALGLCIRPAA
jgi:hypothetical protein